MRGYVYLAGTSIYRLGIFKVGCSRRPHLRMAQIWIPGVWARPNVVAKWWVTDQRRAEWLAHQALAAHRVEGEWFQIEEGEAREVISRTIRDAIQAREFPPPFPPRKVRTLYNAVDRGDFPPRNAQPFTGGPKAKRRGKK